MTPQEALKYLEEHPEEIQEVEQTLQLRVTDEQTGESRSVLVILPLEGVEQKPLMFKADPGFWDCDCD